MIVIITGTLLRQILLTERHAASILTLLHIVINICMMRLTRPQGAYVYAKLSASCTPNPVGRYPTCIGRFKPDGNHVEYARDIMLTLRRALDHHEHIVMGGSVELTGASSLQVTLLHVLDDVVETSYLYESLLAAWINKSRFLHLVLCTSTAFHLG